MATVKYFVTTGFSGRAYFQYSLVTNSVQIWPLNTWYCSLQMYLLCWETYDWSKRIQLNFWELFRASVWLRNFSRCPLNFFLRQAKQLFSFSFSYPNTTLVSYSKVKNRAIPFFQKYIKGLRHPCVSSVFFYKGGWILSVIWPKLFRNVRSSLQRFLRALLTGTS